MKTCIKCNELKTIENFWKNGNSHKSTCIPCMAKIRAARKKQVFPIDISLKEKKCCTCLIIKPISLFNKDKYVVNGYAKVCKECRSLSNKKLYIENREEKIESSKVYYESNKKKIIKKSNLKNIEKRKQDPMFTMIRRLRNRLWYALHLKGWQKNSNFDKYIGCTHKELIVYLESKFQPGMTWENKGQWHIDHIIPLSSATSEAQLYDLCHYSNLQPLWAKDNIKKGNKIE